MLDYLISHPYERKRNTSQIPYLKFMNEISWSVYGVQILKSSLQQNLIIWKTIHQPG